ncbi:MAG: HAMP domain-containing histidine kinase, partial [Ignavibacteriaceae bacterium]
LSPYECGYTDLPERDFSSVRLFFLFPPDDNSLLAATAAKLSETKSNTIVIVASNEMYRSLPQEIIEMVHDHLVYPSDTFTTVSKLRLYRSFLIPCLTSVAENELEDLKSKVLELEEQNISKDKFFAIIAHDLKNPFTGFLGFSEYIAKYYDEITKEDLGDFSVRMYDSARLVYDLIENLLAWSRLRTGNIAFEPIRLNLSETTEHVLKLCEQSVIKKEINLVNTLPKRIEVFADGNMLDTVVRNVITNAIKFTPRGGVIHVGHMYETGKTVMFVADSGVGIPEDIQKKMFRLGYRVSNDGTDGETGTGLGLILSKEFMLKNDGDLYFESKPGNGTKFFISLPNVN